MSRSLRTYLLFSLGCCVYFVPMLAKAESQRLFYCEQTNTYYPYAQTCPVPWKEVDRTAAAQPAPAQAASAAPTQLASASLPADSTSHHVIAYPIGMPPPAQTPMPAAAPAVLTPAVATMISPASELATSQGPVTYVYGAETTPTIVCAVSQLCDMALQPGEKINHIILGDPEHWKVETLEEGGPGTETLHLIMRPASADLSTSMIVLTRTRSYHVQLQSHRKDYMLQVAFSYPEAQVAAVPASAPVAETVSITQSTATQDSDDGFVHVGGVTYVNGREPTALGSGKVAEPPAPAAVPRPEVSKQPTP